MSYNNYFDRFKVKSITLEVECLKCKKPLEVTSTEVKTKYVSCDCDYPCGCYNGEIKYIDHKCPHCGYENRTIIATE